VTLDEILKETRPKMEERFNRFIEEVKTLRAGKAETSLVEDVPVSYYGTTLPLKQLASISTPSPTLIVITPFDKNAINDIELAIINSNLGFSPANDGNVVRISLPPLSEERRKELVKILKDKAEETRIALRNIRQTEWQKVVLAEREGKIGEDDRYKGEEELNKLIADFNKKIEENVSQKEKEIMRV